MGHCNPEAIALPACIFVEVRISHREPVFRRVLLQTIENGQLPWGGGLKAETQKAEHKIGGIQKAE
jgi:hypothetical protein